MADSKGGSREFHLLPPPPHPPIRPVSIFTSCLIPKFFQRQDGILLFNFKYIKLTHFDMFLGFLWLSIMKTKNDNKAIIRITIGTLNQKFLDLPLHSAHHPTKTSSHSQSDQRYYGGKVSHPCEVNINPLPPMGDKDRISPYNINTISRRQVMRTKKSIIQGIIR